MPFSQSRSWRFPIPFLAFPNPAPAFSSDGSGSASFYRCAPAGALPHSRPGRFFLSPPPGFSPIPFLAFSNPTSDLSARTAAGLPVLLSRPGGFPLRMGNDSAAAAGGCPRMDPPSPSPLRRRRPPGQDVNALADIAFSPAQAAAPPGTPKPVPLARAGGFCTFRAVRGKRPFPRATAGGERPRSVPQARLPCAAAARRAVSGLHPAQIGTVSA